MLRARRRASRRPPRALAAFAPLGAHRVTLAQRGQRLHDRHRLERRDARQRQLAVVAKQRARFGIRVVCRRQRDARRDLRHHGIEAVAVDREHRPLRERRHGRAVGPAAAEVGQHADDERQLALLDLASRFHLVRHADPGRTHPPQPCLSAFTHDLTSRCRFFCRCRAVAAGAAIAGNSRWEARRSEGRGGLRSQPQRPASARMS